MDNVTVQDLISLSYDQKPVDFQHAFNTLMSDKVATAINNAKVEVAQTMFKDQQEEEAEQELEVTDQEEPSDG